MISNLSMNTLATDVVVCTKCNKEKKVTEFYKREKNKLRKDCKACTKKRTKEYSNNNKDYYKEYYQNHHLLTTYGITLEDYDKIKEEQGGKCKICGIEEKHVTFSRFHVDHCHETDVIRGLLCSKCNQAIGLLQDNPNFCREAANYLEETQWN